MILTLAYSSSFFGISCEMKVCDSVDITQSKEKRTRFGSLYVTSIYLYAITIPYYYIVRYKNIDNISLVKVIGLNKGRVKLFNIAFELISMKNVVKDSLELRLQKRVCYHEELLPLYTFTAYLRLTLRVW